MISRILGGVAIIALGVAFLSHQMYRRTAEKLAAAEERIVGFEVQQEYLKRLRDVNAGWDQITEEVGGSDAPLSGYLDNAAGRLWP